ncbi:hypothetical protein OKW76_10480 [Sphingomonas sp. S1-29]|uniref:hypothetical protein n=1 Tax=Sphingomonas sp. S1-29 TaxID=2991074 RepID=UPI00223F952B|nr:hypothetical protein [Sphingomonas sp. S1-29]UZK68484.1 hypothetical protein OKW76_10480 [Sphingomonas sp. S1-29]
MLLPLLALALAAPATAAAQDSQAADVTCVAVLGAIVNTVPEAQRPGVLAGTMYYVGRIDGREPGFDLQKAILATLPSDEAGLNAFVKQHTPRCGSQLQDNAKRLASVGNAVQARAKTGGAAPKGR